VDSIRASILLNTLYINSRIAHRIKLIVAFYLFSYVVRAGVVRGFAGLVVGLEFALNIQTIFGGFPVLGSGSERGRGVGFHGMAPVSMSAVA